MSNSGDTGISGKINHNSDLILKTIISKHHLFCKLEDSGILVKKNTLIRCAVIFFFENLAVFRKNSTILHRCTNRISTDKLLNEISQSIIPRVKIELKRKKDNKMTTISTQVTPQSLKTIGMIICSPAIQSFFEKLGEDGFIIRQNTCTIKSVLIRAAICYFLENLDDLEKNISLYQRAVTLKSSEKVLQKIYLELYGGSEKISKLASLGTSADNRCTLLEKNTRIFLNGGS